MSIYLELPRFFKDLGWQDLPLLAPPGPDGTAKELDDLFAMQESFDERRRRQPEIEYENGNDTPAYQRLMLFGSGSATYRLMQAMSLVGGIVAAHYKFRYNRARPSQLDPRLRPMIDVPGHPAYPSGHSIQNHLIAKALATVCRNQEVGDELFKIAWRVAENREWAGVHYRSDTEAGRWLAFEIFPYVEDAFEETFREAAQEWL